MLTGAPAEALEGDWLTRKTVGEQNPAKNFRAAEQVQSNDLQEKPEGLYRCGQGISFRMDGIF